MFKKVLLLSKMIVCLFVLLACNGESEKPAIRMRGVWYDGVYISEYLGLEFHTPEGWYRGGTLRLGDEDIFDGEEIPDDIFVEERDVFQEMVSILVMFRLILQGFPSQQPVHQK